MSHQIIHDFIRHRRKMATPDLELIFFSSLGDRGGRGQVGEMGRDVGKAFTSSWAYFSLCCKVFSLQLSSCAVRRRASNDFAKVCTCRSCSVSVATGAVDILPLFKQYYRRMYSSSVKNNPSALAEAQHSEHETGRKKMEGEAGRKARD